MRSKIASRILSETPEEIKIYSRLYADLIVRIKTILKEQEMSQKLLSEKLGKQPSEIHKWLSSEHNFTLRSIAKLQAELGEILLEVPERKKVTEFNAKVMVTKNTKTVYRDLDNGVVPSENQS